MKAADLHNRSALRLLLVDNQLPAALARHRMMWLSLISQGWR
jgi:hypothetical protein